jgi:hypothetical protein
VVDHLIGVSVPIIASRSHDVVIVMACAGAADASAVPGEHPRLVHPMSGLHQVAFCAAPVEKDVAEDVPELVRVDLNTSVSAAPLDHLV